MKKAGRPQGSKKTGLKYLNPQQLSAFLKAVDSSNNIRNQFMFRLCLYLGLRVGELARIRLADVDFDEIKITIAGLKNGRKQTYDVEGSLWRRLKKWLAVREVWANRKSEWKKNYFLFPHRLEHDRHITTQAIKRAFKTYCNDAELSVDFSVHSLRHTCAVLMVKDGTSPVQIMKWLRHRSVTSTQVYFEMIEFDNQAEEAKQTFGKYL